MPDQPRWKKIEKIDYLALLLRLLEY